MESVNEAEFVPGIIEAGPDPDGILPLETIKRVIRDRRARDARTWTPTAEYEVQGAANHPHMLPESSE